MTTEAKTEPYVKCQRAKPCKLMSERLGSVHGKGLSMPQVCNMNTGKIRYIGIVYKTSAKDPGLLLNICPWCRELIDWTGEPPETPEPAKESE